MGGCNKNVILNPLGNILVGTTTDGSGFAETEQPHLHQVPIVHFRSTHHHFPSSGTSLKIRNIAGCHLYYLRWTNSLPNQICAWACFKTQWNDALTIAKHRQQHSLQMFFS
jgi:hypothetical protein